MADETNKNKQLHKEVKQQEREYFKNLGSNKKNNKTSK